MYVSIVNAMYQMIQLIQASLCGYIDLSSLKTMLHGLLTVYVVDRYSLIFNTKAQNKNVEYHVKRISLWW